jgi:hypothetical protein
MDSDPRRPLPAIPAVEMVVATALRRKLERLCFEQGLPTDSALVLRVLRALESPIGVRDFCAFCGMTFIRHRRWQRFCGVDCRNHYHGQAKAERLLNQL